MFGSNRDCGLAQAFGQSSSSPHGSQPVSGKTINASGFPFAPQSFGSTNPFGSQTGGSIFGGMSPAVFGAQSSPTSVFGVSSAPAFGSSTPTFGASSGPAFGNSSSAFGGHSMFGQKHAFGCFGSTTIQTSPFGSSFQQSQPAFGNNMFGSSTPFGAPCQPAFGSSSSHAFVAQTAPAFGASTPAFGSSTATPIFGSKSGGFGASTFAFGTSASAFGAPSTPSFGATSTPAFSNTATPAFGAASAPSFNFGSSPLFGQSTFTFGNASFGTSAQTSFGVQTTNPAFGNQGFPQSTFGGHCGGSRVSPYSPTLQADGATGTKPARKLESISAMLAYKDKSLEELRWEDYQSGDKGGAAPASQAPVSGFCNTGFTSSTPGFGLTSANHFTSSNTVAPKTAFGTPSFFGSTSSATPSFFGNTTQAFVGNSSPSLFSSTTTSGFGSQFTVGPSSAHAITSAFGTSLSFGNTKSSSSRLNTLTQTSNTFGHIPSAFGQTAPVFGQSNLFRTPSIGFGNMFSSTSSLPNSDTPSVFGQATLSPTTPFQSAQQPMISGSFNMRNFGQSQSADTSGYGGTPWIFSNNTFGQSSGTQSCVVAQVPPITNPFGTLPPMPPISFSCTGTSPIQYGSFSLPVVEEPGIPSLFPSQHHSQRRRRLHVKKHHPQNEHPKVSFFNGDTETPSTPKADAVCVPKEKPSALEIPPLEHWHPLSDTEETNAAHTPVHENDDPPENDKNHPTNHDKSHQKTSGPHKDVPTEKSNSYITLTGHRASEAAIAYEHGADIEALMPKLRHSDYFTEPRVQELAAKERAEPGFCCRVKDFVVGRNGYGSIKFLGETDVRRLELESLVQFNKGEVVVYMDESKRPPFGHGLNKPAEVTLLNVMCFDKKSGQQYTEGPRVEKYREMLRKKAEDQGAEFMSYDAVKGEWKFRLCQRVPKG